MKFSPTNFWNSLFLMSFHWHERDSTSFAKWLAAYQPILEHEVQSWLLHTFSVSLINTSTLARWLIPVATQITDAMLLQSEKCCNNVRRICCRVKPWIQTHGNRRNLSQDTVVPVFLQFHDLTASINLFNISFIYKCKSLYLFVAFNFISLNLHICFLASLQCIFETPLRFACLVTLKNETALQGFFIIRRNTTYITEPMQQLQQYRSNPKEFQITEPVCVFNNIMLM